MSVNLVISHNYRGLHFQNVVLPVTSKELYLNLSK